MTDRYGWKLTGPRFNTMNDFIWDVSGGPNISNHNLYNHVGNCPAAEGDGLTVALCFEQLGASGNIDDYNRSLRGIFSVVHWPTWLLRVRWDSADELTPSPLKKRIGGPVHVEGFWHLSDLVPLAEVPPMQPLCGLNINDPVVAKPLRSKTKGSDGSMRFEHCDLSSLSVEGAGISVSACSIKNLKVDQGRFHGGTSLISRTQIPRSGHVAFGHYVDLEVAEGAVASIGGDTVVVNLDIAKGARVTAGPSVRVYNQSGPGELSR